MRRCQTSPLKTYHLIKVIHGTVHHRLKYTSSRANVKSHSSQLTFMLEWEGLKEEIKKAKSASSWTTVVREVLPSALEKIDKQLKLLTDKVNELSEGVHAS